MTSKATKDTLREYDSLNREDYFFLSAKLLKDRITTGIWDSGTTFSKDEAFRWIDGTKEIWMRMLSASLKKKTRKVPDEWSSEPKGVRIAMSVAYVGIDPSDKTNTYMVRFYKNPQYDPSVKCDCPDCMEAHRASHYEDPA